MVEQNNINIPIAVENVLKHLPAMLQANKEFASNVTDSILKGGTSRIIAEQNAAAWIDKYIENNNRLSESINTLNNTILAVRADNLQTRQEIQGIAKEAFAQPAGSFNWMMLLNPQIIELIKKLLDLISQGTEKAKEKVNELQEQSEKNE